MSSPELVNRPIIFDYRSIPQYVDDRISWLRKVDSNFSVRKKLSSIQGCSPALITQIIKGTRGLTRDRVDALGKLLELNETEVKYLDQWLKEERKPQEDYLVPETKTTKRSKPQNHLLSDWLNVYVKDAVDLKGFAADKKVIFQLLGGITSPKRIEKSLNFLLREGFLKRDLRGKIVSNDEVTTTTNNIPNIKIRKFHKKALEIARAAIERFPSHRRKAYAVTMTLDEEEYQELRDLISEFYERLIKFSEKKKKHLNKKRSLFYQVLINLSPIGGKAGHEYL